MDSPNKPRRAIDPRDPAATTPRDAAATNPRDPATNPRDPEVVNPRDPVAMAADKPRLLSSTMVMASGTLASRILGMVRVLLVTYLLGSLGRQGDMFSFATEIPSTAYMLLAGGVLNAILVPQLMRAMSRDADGGQAFSDRIVTLFTILVGAATIILMAALPVIMWLMVDQGWRAPEMAAQYHSILLLAALCMPQVFFFGIFFLLGQILNARGSFGPLMWAPVANNVIQILMLGMYAVVWGFHSDTLQPFSTAQILVLGIGSVVGVACQAGILVPYLRKVGFTYRPRFDFLHTGLAGTAHMAKWAIALVAIDQVNYIVIVRLASSATYGGYGSGLLAFNNAMLISLVPHALLTVSLVTALMPSLSNLSSLSHWDRFSDQLVSSLKTIYAAMIPISMLFLAVGVPLGVTVFTVGKGGVYIGWTLALLGIGLIPFTLRFVANKAFNSMTNTRTPFFVEIVFVGVTCLASVLLILVFRVPSVWVAPSIGGAYTLAYVSSSALSWKLLRRAVPTPLPPIAGHTARLIAISVPGALLAGALCWLQTRYFPGLVLGLLGLVVAGFLGIGVYWGLAKLIRVSEIQELESMIRSRLRKEADVEPVKPDADTTAADQDATGSDSLTAAIPYLPSFGAEETQPVLTGLSPLVPGVLVAGRYRLGELVSSMGAATRWTAVDEGLSRPVVLTAFPNDENTATILEAARVASGAMDARFLRIMDAGQDADHAYIVSETTDGVTLAALLSHGPLSAEESAWVVATVASALASIHAMRLYHCRIDPTKVWVSSQGGVKISGLRVDQALTPRDADDSLTRTDMEAMDVVACGGLLYACLTATWPGAASIGLPLSPRSGDGLQPPVAVRPGTSVALDRLTHQILSIRDPERIATAAGVAEAMSTTLGSMDPTASLAARVAALDVPPAPTPEPPGKAIKPTILPAELGTDGYGSDDTTMAVSSDLTVEHSTPGTPLKPPVPPEAARWWSRVFLGLIVLVALALVTALIVGLYNLSHHGDSTGPAAITVRPIVTAAVFDSETDGGDGTENDELVPRAYDQDPSTAWLTERYPTATYIPDYKPGVGLVFDLGSAVPVSQVSLTVNLTPTAVSVYVPQGDPSKVTTPDMTTIKDWTQVTSAPITTAQTTLQFTSVTTRYVVVYITKLVPEGDVAQADLAEVSFSG